MEVVVFRETFRKQFKEENPDVKGVTAVFIPYSPVAFMNLSSCLNLFFCLCLCNLRSLKIVFPPLGVEVGCYACVFCVCSVPWYDIWGGDLDLSLDLECVVCNWHWFGMMHSSGLCRVPRLVVRGGCNWLKRLVSLPDIIYTLEWW